MVDSIHKSADNEVLKSDLFGEVTLVRRADQTVIRRNTLAAPGWTRWLARWLMRREARALLCVEGLPGVPQITQVDRDSLERTFLDGQPMQKAKPQDPAYFRDARRLLSKLHRRQVVHNDLAKEPNLLVTDTGRAAIIDFQLAMPFRGRGRFFRLLAREDIRHLLKHKRTYCPEQLTARERAILATPSLLSRIYMTTVKPVYLFVTRRILGWSDREGAGDRGAVR